jgi:Spy/CpxP family protein refolding chaperone
MRASFEEMRASGTRPDPTTMRETMTKMMKEVDAEVNKVLKPEQQTRLKEISIQLDGNKAVMKPEIQKDLAITDAQKAKLKTLQEGSQAASQSVMEKARNREIQWTEVQDIMKKNDKILNDEIGKVLTPAQKTKLTEMGGKKFVEKLEEKG